MYIYRTAVAKIIPPPHFFEDLFAAKHMSLIFRKIDEQFVFFGFELHHFSIDMNLAAILIDLQIVKNILLFLVWLRLLILLQGAMS